MQWCAHARTCPGKGHREWRRCGWRRYLGRSSDETRRRWAKIYLEIQLLIWSKSEPCGQASGTEHGPRNGDGAYRDGNVSGVLDGSILGCGGLEVSRSEGEGRRNHLPRWGGLCPCALDGNAER